MARLRKYRYMPPLLLCVPTIALFWALSGAQRAPAVDLSAVWLRARREALACVRLWPALDQCLWRAAPTPLPSQQPPWAPPPAPTAPRSLPSPSVNTL
jgi:hypothetical protein